MNPSIPATACPSRARHMPFALVALIAAFAPTGPIIAAELRSEGAELVRLVGQATKSGSPDDAFAAGQFAARKEGFTFAPGTIANYQVAAEWYERAANQGHVEAAFQLGELLCEGALRQHDPACLPWYVKAAQRGHRAAASRLGEILSENHGQITRDLAEATRWSMVAAQAGDTTACHHLGLLLLDPDNPKRDEIAAKEWLRRASAGGEVRATARLMLLDGGEAVLSQDAVAALKMAAEQWSSREAHFILGHAYMAGKGVPKDPEKALRHFGRVMAMSWSQGLPTALQRAGPKDFELLHGAAERMVALYASGELTPKSQAIADSPLPTEPDHVVSPAARLQLAELLWTGNPLVPRAPAAGVEWFTRAALAGSPGAMRRLAQFWRDGVAGTPDPAEAELWEHRAKLAESEGDRRRPATTP